MHRAIVAFFFLVALALPSFASAQGVCPAPLSRGMSGPRVIQLQQLLHQAYLQFGADNITGFYGPLTEAAVKQWQVDHNIVSSGTPATTGWGVAGPRTLRAMGLCPGGTTPPTTTPPPTTVPPPVTPPMPLGSCLLNSQVLQHGTSITRYESFSVPPGQQCRVQQRTCFNGVLSGSYLYPTCSVQGSGTTTPPTTTPPATTTPPVATTTGTVTLSGTAVLHGAQLTVSWNFTNAPAGSKVRLEFYKQSDNVVAGNNDRGLASATSQLGTSGSYTWTVPSGDACIADGGYVSCAPSAGTYKIVAKLYSGNTCWGFCTPGEGRTIHSTAQSATFTIGPTTTASCTVPDRDLRLGDEDANKAGQVSVLQRFLSRDSAIYPEGLVTGYFGQATERAVVRFQSANNVSPTGFVGPLTRAAMQAVCDGKPAPSPSASSFKAAPAAGAAPLNVTFTATGYEELGGFVYIVDFGDGERAQMTGTASSRTVSHSYASAGTYSARLLQVEYLCGGVSMGYGCDRELSVNGAKVTVSAPPAPPAPATKKISVTCSVSSAFEQSLVIRLADGTEKRFDVGVGEITKTYEFESESLPTSLSAFHNRTEPNFPRITTTSTSIRIESEDLTDNDYNDLVCTVSWGTSPGGGGEGGGGGGGTSGDLGCVDTPPDQVSTSQTCFNLAGNTLTLTVGGGISGPNSFRIRWGDGATDAWFNTQPVNHVYAAAGTYTVTLEWKQITRDGSFVDRSVTKTITVGGEGGSGAALGCIDTFGDSNSSLQTCFTLSGRTLSLRQQAPAPSQTISINVVWGDGQSQNWFGSSPVTHTYAAAGTYSVVLTWTFRDFAGGTTVVRTATKQVTI